jgi:NOL1/NOP2/fmu family ribosome biogenesis protein
MIHSLNKQQGSIPTESIRWDFSWPEFVKDERHDLFSYLEQRFGIDSGIFCDYFLLKKNKSWWLLRKSEQIKYASSLKVWMTGLKAFQAVGKYIKPTTRMIQVFGSHAVLNRMEVTEEDINIMSQGKYISSDIKTDNGYIILSFKAAVIGLGLFIDGRITSQIPRRDLVSFIAPGNGEMPDD